MKKTIFILILPLLLLSSCLNEGRDGCVEEMRLIFQHNESVEEFDSKIGNDVYLHIYKDDILFRTMHIPYALIKGGKEYVITKEFTGRLNIAAWAVPPTGDEELIPEAPIGSRYSTAQMGNKSITRAEVQVHPMGDLYLGKIDVYDDMLKATTYKVSMTNAVCRVKVIVLADELFEETASFGAPNIQLRGSATNATLDFVAKGDEAAIYTDLLPGKDQSLTTTTLGLMPSKENQTLQIKGLSGDQAIFIIDTDEVSQSGKEIVIIIGHLTAEIYVNGWRVKTTDIKSLT